jgi:hypothetical protein
VIDVVGVAVTIVLLCVLQLLRLLLLQQLMLHLLLTLCRGLCLLVGT